MTAADCASFLVTENGLPVTDQTGNFVLDEEAVTAYVGSWPKSMTVMAVPDNSTVPEEM